MKKKFGGIVGLFVVAFLVGAALTLSMASQVFACSQGFCHEDLMSCYSFSPCPGEPCIVNWDGYAGSGRDKVCCGTPTQYFCPQ